MRRRKEQPHPLDHAAKEIVRLVPDLIPRPIPLSRHRVIDDLLGWTFVLGNQFFPYETLRNVFEKEIEMLKDFPEVQQWIAEGREQGGLRRARLICNRTLTERFGPLSPAAEAYLDLRTADELGDLVVRSLRASDLAALGIPA